MSRVVYILSSNTNKELPLYFNWYVNIHDNTCICYADK